MTGIAYHAAKHIQINTVIIIKHVFLATTRWHMTLQSCYRWSEAKNDPSSRHTGTDIKVYFRSWFSMNRVQYSLSLSSVLVSISSWLKCLALKPASCYSVALVVWYWPCSEQWVYQCCFAGMPAAAEDRIYQNRVYGPSILNMVVWLI